jgi:hypothetical protein
MESLHVLVTGKGRRPNQSSASPPQEERGRGEEAIRIWSLGFGSFTRREEV